MDDPDASPDKFLALKVLQSYLHIIDSEYLRQNTTSTDLSIERGSLTAFIKRFGA